MKVYLIAFVEEEGTYLNGKYITQEESHLHGIYATRELAERALKKIEDNFKAPYLKEIEEEPNEACKDYIRATMERRWEKEYYDIWDFTVQTE